MKIQTLLTIDDNEQVDAEKYQMKEKIENENEVLVEVQKFVDVEIEETCLRSPDVDKVLSYHQSDM